MITNAYTFQYDDDGVILNTDPPVPFVDVTNITGLDSAPVRNNSRTREGMDGGFVDAVYEDPRTIVIDGQIYGSDGTTDDFLDSLKANYAPSSTSIPFYFMGTNGSVRVVLCKSVGLRYAWDLGRRLNIIPIQITLVAEDPTIYGLPVAVTGYLNPVQTGRGYNKSYNFGYGGVTVGTNQAVVNNVGNKDTPAIITISGPVTDPSIIDSSSGNRLDFSITLDVGDSLSIDLRNKTVVLNNLANRRGTMKNTSRWFLLPPGISPLLFTGTAGVGGTPIMTVTYSPAYR